MYRWEEEWAHRGSRQRRLRLELGSSVYSILAHFKSVRSAGKELKIKMKVDRVFTVKPQGGASFLSDGELEFTETFQALETRRRPRDRQYFALASPCASSVCN